MSSHRVYQQVDESLKTMIASVANNNPAPQEVLIKDTSYDGSTWFADIDLHGGLVRRVPCMGYPIVDHLAIVIFLNGSYSHPRLLCNPLDSVDYVAPFTSINLVDNGNFYDGVRGWAYSNGVIAVDDGVFGDKCVKIPPNRSIRTPRIDISSLTTNELDVIQVYYQYKGAGITTRVRNPDTAKYLTFAPENLEQTSMTHEASFQSWTPCREVFLKRDNDNIYVYFNNNTTDDVYLDGVRVWLQDFNEWSPSINDYENGVRI